MKTRKDVQADFEAMDMLKDNETTSGYYGDIESILDSLDDGICNVMDKHIAKNFTSKNGYLFFEDDDILDSYEFAMNILKRLIKHTHKKDVKFCENCGKSEYAHLLNKKIINWKRSIKNSYNEWTWLDLAEEIQSMVSREDIEELIYFLKQVQLSSASSSELIKEK